MSDSIPGAPILSVKVDRVKAMGLQTYQRRRGSKVTNPVITAMLSSNNLSDCAQVKDLLYHCKENDSSAVICQTAARYLDKCEIETS
mmetsp:Transcript_11147/g.16865  ORF Transcript_11147/g.16865 Transcript_11147/m.16865 type:complete len:87 (-) Transcript_11147:447-707(-)